MVSVGLLSPAIPSGPTPVPPQVRQLPVGALASLAGL